MYRPVTRSNLLLLAASLVLALSAIVSVVGPNGAIAQDDSPVGDWSVALGRNDIPVEIASAFSYVGRWRLVIENDGTYFAERGDVGLAVQGTWTADGDQITFTDEAGLLSCAAAAAAPIIDQDMTSGTYAWERSEDSIRFTRIDDTCPGRVILLTTFPFTTFVACQTDPISIPEILGTPSAGEAAEPPIVPEPTIEPSAVDSVASPVAVTGPPLPDTSTRSTGLDFAAEVDALLDQMTACWATRDPERWLPLLSTEFRSALVGSDPNFVETLTITMSSPIVWERAGDITIEAPNKLSAVVKSTVGTEEDFQQFVFVFEDGRWKWDG